MSSVIVAGDTSGSVTLQAPAVSGSTVLTLPTTTGTLVVNSGAQTIEFADGSASAPSITNSGDTNTGIFFPAADTIAFAEGGTESMRLDSSGNLGLGVTPSAWGSSYKAIQLGSFGALETNNGNKYVAVASNHYNNGSGDLYIANGFASRYYTVDGTHVWNTAPTGTAGNTITFTQAMTLTNTGLDINATFGGGTFPFRVGYTTAGTYYPNMVLNDSGNLLVGLTATGAYLDGRINAQASGGSPAICAKLDPSGATTQFVYSAWAPYTTGNQVFHSFQTETTAVVRGTISYNRAGGLTVYNTTSDYRAKTVNGVVENALEKVALLKPCTGRMNGASEDIDFFVAHELQEVVPSAVTGEKDAVKEDGTPDYQMVDKSAIIPLLTAAIQELKAIVDTQAEQIKALQGVK